MAQFYTLEEAARVLGMSSEELKSKAQAREVRAFLDGGSWRFRVVDIDELARRRGLGSDAELRLSDLEVPAASGMEEGADLDLSEFQLGVSRPDLGSETTQFKAKGAPDAEGSSEHDILLDDLSLPPNPVTGSSSVIIGVSASGKHPSDSDVRLVPDNVKGASDSDVRLATPDSGLRAPSDSDVTLIKDDTADHGVLAGSGSDTGVRPAPFLGSSAEVPASQADSDFDLNPSSELIDALQPESGSDFELTALDASDEFEATPISKASDSDVTAADPNISGINLSRPSDSGINLQGPGLGLGAADSIELAPLSDEEIKTPQAARPAPPKKSLAKTPPPSVKKGEKDIFDDTDFEVDVPLSDDDSDDQTVQLEAASDFELEESDSASEVFAIDEEAVDQNAATAMAPSTFVGDEDEEDDGFDAAVSSDMASAWSSSDTTSSAGDRAGPAVVLSRGEEQEWGGLWVGLLGVTTVLIFLLSFVSLDMVRNLYEFRDGSGPSGLVRTIAGLFGG
ncbi:MAG: helix-turn-helix domain-containing protein [Isosphaeraceae bacterium]